MQAKSKPIDTATAADLGIDVTSGQTIASVDPVPARDAGEMVEDDGAAFSRIIAMLEDKKVI